MPGHRTTNRPASRRWSDMNTHTDSVLEEQYKRHWKPSGEQDGILDHIFQGTINKVYNATILYRIVQIIDREKWISMSSDVRGEIYEDLL